jgi:hypothetical protein
MNYRSASNTAQEPHHDSLFTGHSGRVVAQSQQILPFIFTIIAIT